MSWLAWNLSSRLKDKWQKVFSLIVPTLCLPCGNHSKKWLLLSLACPSVPYICHILIQPCVLSTWKVLHFYCFQISNADIYLALLVGHLLNVMALYTKQSTVLHMIVGERIFTCDNRMKICAVLVDDGLLNALGCIRVKIKIFWELGTFCKYTVKTLTFIIWH